MDEVVVVRFGQADTALLRAKAGRDGLTVTATRRADVPSLTRDDAPNGDAAGLLATLYDEVGGGLPVTVCLPASATRTIRLEAEAEAGAGAPAGMPLSERRLAALVGAGRRRAGERGDAVLSCRLTDDPAAGDRASALRMSATTAPLAVLSRIGATVSVAGAAFAGVVAAPDAIAAALLPGGDGVAVRVGQARTLCARASGASVTNAVHVPVGRGHVLRDLMAALGVGAAEAEGALIRFARGGRDDASVPIIAARLAEMEELLSRACDADGFEAAAAVLSGLPASCFLRDAGATQAGPDDPALSGAALVSLGLWGHYDAPVFGGSAPAGVLGWLRRRF